MKHKEQEFYAPREHKQSRYDKRLILKIVRELEEKMEELQ
jgi:transposase